MDYFNILNILYIPYRIYRLYPYRGNMRLSKRGEYGLRAMIRLAEMDNEGNTVQIREIAALENIPIKFLEQILVTLKNAGYLHSRKGVGGGYYLARTPREINLGSIIRILDGPLAPIKCVSRTAYEFLRLPGRDHLWITHGYVRCTQCHGRNSRPNNSG